MRIKLFIASCMLGLLLGCAGKAHEDQALLAQAREAAEAASFAKPERISASIRPESSAVFSAMRGNIALVGLYRQYPDGSARFALSLPQGTRMGSAEQPAAGKPEFKTLSPSAVVSSLVRSSYYAMEGASELAPKAGDEWSLRQGDHHAGKGTGELLLVRHRRQGRGAYSNLVYDLAGKPLAFYQVSDGRLKWKMVFIEGDTNAFTFRDRRYDWILRVELVKAAE